MKVVLEHLTKKYPNRDKKNPDYVIAVNDFSFEIPDGLLIGLLGPSGCGKSTALNLISGLEAPTEGKIYFDDTDVTDLPPEDRGIGLVFQNYALYPHMTARKNIMFPLQNLKGDAKLTKEELEEKVQWAAGLVQIGNLLERKPSEMSGGQQQRVAIARALVKKPHVLLMDEPLSNLDARLRLQTREEIRRIQQETGLTTIFVTHDQEEAMSICDQIVVMKTGVVHQIGRPQTVYDDPVDLFVAQFLGTPAINVLEGTVADGVLHLAGDAVLAVPGAPDGDVWVGIRPEGFVPSAEGRMRCSLTRVEVLGRDTSIISAHPASSAAIRCIVSAENSAEVTGNEVRFDLKPDKVLLFDKETELRIHFDLKD